ncbi:MAG: electron transfer flavoprotein subunit beta/FixA family protein [Sporichthyaceae bacterium]
MNIVVCVKQVPDTWAEKKLDPSTKTLDRVSADNILNEMDEFAIEEALQITTAHGGTVTVLSMGPESATEAIRKALSMGADAAVHVVDDALKGSCAVATSLALAKAIEKIGDVDLVIAGSESSDSRTSVVPAMLAERLGLPQVTFVNKVEVDPAAKTLRAHRLTDDGYQVVESTLPAVISAVEKMNEPRYPSFKGIMAAKKKPVTTYSIGDLGLDAASVGLAGSWTSIADYANRPPRSAGTVVEDEGNGGIELVDFLVTGKFV